jgi:ATP-binding cassette, subfamily C (CFTR/MRP), member 10
MGSDEWWVWKWEKFCETGLNITSNTSSITPCFQQMHIQLPTFAWMAIFSSFHYGMLSNEIYRNRTQLICLNFRAVFALGLALTPAIQILNTMDHEVIWPVDILLTCVQFIAWTVHFGESLAITKQKKF